MLALYHVAWLYGHIVTQVVETELVVGTECDVGKVCTATCIRVGLMLVDAVHAESMEHVERSHPLRVTLCKVVVHGYHVYTVSGKCIKEHRQGRNECLTLTCRHLGNLALMEYCTAEQLYIVVNHVPYGVVTAGLPVVAVYRLVAVDAYKVELCGKLTVKVIGRDNDGLVLGKAACAVLHDCKGLGQRLIKCLVEHLEHLLLQLVNLVEDRFSLLKFRILDFCLQFCYSCTQFSSAALNLLLERCRCGTQLIVAKLRDSGVHSLHLVNPRLNLAHVSACLVAEKFAYKFVKTHI